MHSSERKYALNKSYRNPGNTNIVPYTAHTNFIDINKINNTKVYTVEEDAQAPTIALPSSGCSLYKQCSLFFNHTIRQRTDVMTEKMRFFSGIPMGAFTGPIA
jgi:hypothetical protein